MKIVVFSGIENNGGVQQFAITIVRTLIKLGNEVTFFLPDEKTIMISEDLKKVTYRYNKIDSIVPGTRAIRKIAKSVEVLGPDIFICPEDTIISMQVLGALNPQIVKCFVIHDVSPHPSRQGIKRRLVSMISRKHRVYGLRKTNKVLLLSENSLSKFRDKYDDYEDKALLYRLGAHFPMDNARMPSELGAGFENAYLFFGRIDKYKGIDRMVRSFIAAKSKNHTLKLIVAGNGRLSIEEEKLISLDSNIVIINRFIDNDELVWLFEHCKSVVIPYIEASQSGVIPLAYHYGKTVIASNILGITENVIDGETGQLFNDEIELSEIFLKLSENDLRRMEIKAKEYSETVLSWENNTEKLIEALWA